jgi:hypothetical protein
MADFMAISYLLLRPNFLAGRLSCAKENRSYIARSLVLNRAADRFRPGREAERAVSKIIEE